MPQSWGMGRVNGRFSATMKLRTRLCKDTTNAATVSDSERLVLRWLVGVQNLLPISPS